MTGQLLEDTGNRTADWLGRPSMTRVRTSTIIRLNFEIVYLMISFCLQDSYKLPLGFHNNRLIAVNSFGYYEIEV